MANKILKQFASNHARIGILEKVITKLEQGQDRLNALAKNIDNEVLASTANSSMNDEINIKNSLEYINKWLPKFYKDLKFTKVDIALRNSKIDKNQLRYNDTKSLIIELFEKFGHHKSKIDWVKGDF